MRTQAAAVVLVGLAVATAGACKRPASPARQHLSSMAWTRAEWLDRCRGVRTSFNPSADLGDDTLTLVPGDPRWLDFVYWAIDNKIAEHQVEAYGGTGWKGPEGGVVFHWAPGSHWERDTLASFGFTIGHTIGEHRWMDTMFPDFFEKHGGVFGVNVKDRLAELDPASPKLWIAFLEHAGGARSPYYRYLFHQENVVEPAARRIHLSGGQGVAFSYSFERYFHELREVLTDCRAVDFFEMYDRFGPGFAARGNWARQNPGADLLARVGYASDDDLKAALAGGARYQPVVPPVDVPGDLPEAEAMRAGQKVYLAQCSMCHGIRGDGQGFLGRGFQIRPRDFTQGTYKFRSTAGGELPTIGDIERAVRVGVPGTSMPAWGQFLSEQQIKDVSRYLVVFSERFVAAWKERAAPVLLPVPPAPADLETLAETGAQEYERMQCAQCHGGKGQGDGPSAPTLRDGWGDAIAATNLRFKWTFRNGHEPADVYRTLMGGLDGTPMPAYVDSLTDERARWALVSYVLSLSPRVRPALHLANFAAARATRIAPDGTVMPEAVGAGL